MPKAMTDLQKRREFLIYQLVRLTGVTREQVENLATNELEIRERDYYHTKYNSHGKTEYKPSTL